MNAVCKSSFIAVSKAPLIHSPVSLPFTPPAISESIARFAAKPAAVPAAVPAVTPIAVAAKTEPVSGVAKPAVTMVTPAATTPTPTALEVLIVFSMSELILPSYLALSLALALRFALKLFSKNLLVSSRDATASLNLPSLINCNASLCPSKAALAVCAKSFALVPLASIPFRLSSSKSAKKSPAA